MNVLELHNKLTPLVAEFEKAPRFSLAYLLVQESIFCQVFHNAYRLEDDAAIDAFVAARTEELRKHIKDINRTARMRNASKRFDRFMHRLYNPPPKRRRRARGKAL